jgi:DNA-binding MarR family transcriptional regulator
MADDARRKTVTLTPKAREFSRRLDAIGAQSEQRMAEGFSPQELAQLTAYLKRYEANLDRMLVQEDRS